MSLMRVALVRRFAVSFVGMSLLASLFAVAALSTPRATEEPTTDQIELVGCIGYCAYPRNAGKVFRWGRELWRDEFETGAFPSTWKSNKPGLIGMQHGMFTIKAPSGTQKVVSWREGHKAAYGRWEARVRAVELSGGTPFKFVWQLTPATRNDCNDNKVVMAAYKPGQKRVKARVQARVGDQFNKFTTRLPLDLRSRAWHAYAVEITPTHISWFVDTRVVRTERRSAAQSGQNFIPQFVIESKNASGNRSSWLQMDWVRYYTLDRPNAKSIKAPPMTRGTFERSCY
ncbi:MAG: family 16 glycosylhydrolase [Nocardioides sp.]